MYTTVGFGHTKPLSTETARAQLDHCAKIADETGTVELAIIENPVSRVISLATHADANDNARQLYQGNNADHPLYHFRRHVIDPKATSRRTLTYPDAITGSTFRSLASLLEHEDFKLTAVHVSAKPLVENTNAHGLLETPDISIVGAYDPRSVKDVAAFLDSTEMIGSDTPNHFLGDVLDIRLENDAVAHFQPYALTYHGKITTPDYL